ncbi:MAG: hypothetical protein LC130_17080 [Bryobacterales bacterium]|nr:hypothetical protein [Bryobacterales bacterium]MCZ2288569.1 hypothetical protein [Anaerolineales bacterium]
MRRMTLSGLKDAHAGRTAAVLGGGPSLPADLARVPRDAVLVAVNYHGLYHTPASHGRLPDYMVYNDTPDTNPLMEVAVREHRVPLVSPEPTSDVIFDVPDVWTGFFSSNTATWFALWLGCDPVILCGMDCYQGAAKHCPPSTYHSDLFDFPLEFYTRPWVEEGLNLLPNVERVKAASGPLVDVFGAWA